MTKKKISDKEYIVDTVLIQYMEKGPKKTSLRQHLHWFYQLRRISIQRGKIRPKAKMKQGKYYPE